MFDNIEDVSLTPTQVAKQLRVHVSTVYRWIYSQVRGRKFSSVLVGGRRRILKNHLDAFLQLGDCRVVKTACGRNERAQNTLASFGVRSHHDRSQNS